MLKSTEKVHQPRGAVAVTPSPTQPQKWPVASVSTCKRLNKKQTLKKAVFTRDVHSAAVNSGVMVFCGPGGSFLTIDVIKVTSNRAVDGKSALQTQDVDTYLGTQETEVFCQKTRVALCESYTLSF